MIDAKVITAVSYPASSKRITLSVILLCLSIFACYANSLLNGFVSDDHYIIELEQDALSFRTALHVFVSPDGLRDTEALPYYRPLNRFSYLIDKHFFGLNPVGYHAVNISLHIICSLLVYFTLLHFGCGAVSLFAALLFGVHPVNSEVVNFISARNNMLATIFVLGSLLAFLHAEETKKKGGHFLSGLFFFLGMLSKETTLMLIPFFMFLKIYREKEWRNPRNVLKWDTTFILFHVIFLSIYLFLRSFSLDDNYIHVHMADLHSRIRQLVYIIPAYFSVMVAPFNLNFDYQVPKNYGDIVIPLVIKWLFLCAAAVYLVLKRNQTAIIGLAWFIINFVPISNIIPIPSSSMAERYLYLPMIGIFLIVADETARFTPKHGISKHVVLTSIVLLLGLLTVTRNFDWRDNHALAHSIVKANPSYAAGHFVFGYESYLRGDKTTALREFKTVLDLDPHFDVVEVAWIYYYLGALSVEAQDFQKAEQYFKNASMTNPDNEKAHYALATLIAHKEGHAAVKAYNQFLTHITLSSYHLLPEVRNTVLELEPHNHRSAEAKYTASFPSNVADRDSWIFFHRFPTGTELYYDPTSVHKDGSDITVVMSQRLAKIDKKAFALKLIRFPLEHSTEARFMFTINCLQNLYRMSSMEFRDKDGNVLGKSYPGKEAVDMYEYLMPQTLMRSLSDRICRGYL